MLGRRGSVAAAPLPRPPPRRLPLRPPQKQHLPARTRGGPDREPDGGDLLLKPSPEKPTFVNVGDTVGDDSTVCLIEAMKIFNEIKSDSRARSRRSCMRTATPSSSASRCFSSSLPERTGMFNKI